MKLYHLGTYLQELNASLHLPIIADSVIPNCQLLCNNFVDGSSKATTDGSPFPRGGRRDSFI